MSLYSSRSLGSELGPCFLGYSNIFSLPHQHRSHCLLSAQHFTCGRNYASKCTWIFSPLSHVLYDIYAPLLPLYFLFSSTRCPWLVSGIWNIISVLGLVFVMRVYIFRCLIRHRFIGFFLEYTWQVDDVDRHQENSDKLGPMERHQQYDVWENVSPEKGLWSYLIQMEKIWNTIYIYFSRTEITWVRKLKS